MTDKQIMIDGVDVSGCKHYKNRTCIADYCLTDMPFGEAKCELNSNCYYKQLKRKEQECKKLKEYFETAKEASNCNLKALGEMTEWADKLDEENDQLKAERDELKKQACGLRPELKYIIDKTCSKYNINSKYYHEKIVEIINNLDKLKQTLTEIKEIAEKFCSESCPYKDDDCDICVEDCLLDEIVNPILQKISEVLYVENN